MKKRFGTFLQDLGKSLMMPISVIAAAGIFLGLAAALQNPSITGNAFNQLHVVQIVLGFIRKISGSLFGNLPVFFALAAAIGLAKDEKATAAFAALIGFISFHIGINYSLSVQGIKPGSETVDALMQNQGLDKIAATLYSAEFTSTLGIFTYNMSVLGGVIAGIVTVSLHNRFYTITLPTAINFFGGRRFVPIITVVVLPLVGVLLSFVWPFIGAAIAQLGFLIEKTGPVGTFLFAFSERLLIPTGLHHILNETVRFTPVGGIVQVDEQTIVGALNIFNYALANPGVLANETIQTATRFLSQGKIPVMMFGLPGAALAMYHCARPEHKNRVKALIITGALASFTTGITEPIEFSFIFVSPLLFLIHAILTGLSFALMDIFNVMIGNVQGGVIDLVVFGILGGTQTAWWFTVLLGIIYFPLYYFTFKFFIKRMNIMTPGRDTNGEKNLKASNMNQTNTNNLAESIIEGLGGRNNIKSVDNCFTRLRVKLKDLSLIDETILNNTGANGLNKVSTEDLQVIYGPQVEKIALQVKRAI